MRAAVFGLILFVASVVPVPGGESGAGGAGLDLPLGLGLTEPFHVVGYAVLAALLVAAIDRPGRRRRWVGVVLAIVVATVVGFGIELVQSAVPWRSFAWRDVAINAVGAAIGGVGARVWQRLRSKGRDGDVARRHG